MNLNNIDYIYVENGIDNLMEILVPDYAKESSKIPFEKVLQSALKTYGKYRHQKGFKNNALIVFDNTNTFAKSDENKLENFKTMIKETLVDNKLPLVFVFLSSEGKGPSILLKNNSRMEVLRLNEPSSDVAFQYFEKLGIPKDWRKELEKISGSVFKYLKKIPKYENNKKEEFISKVKKSIDSKFHEDSTLNWLDNERYPELISVCKKILLNGSIKRSEFNKITINEAKEIKDRKSGWSEEVLKGNLFQVDGTEIKFQNRATKRYVDDFLNKKSK